MCRLRGSYENLDGGKLQDAMVDLTGGISEVIDIQKKREVSPELYNLLYTSFQMKSMMGACIFVSFIGACTSSSIKRLKDFVEICFLENSIQSIVLSKPISMLKSNVKVAFN